MKATEFLDIVKSRRVVRRFHRDRQVAEDSLNRILEAAIWAPLSVYHPQEWKFVVLEGEKRDEAVEIIIKDHTVLKYIRYMYEQTLIGHGGEWKEEAEHFGKTLGEAPVVVVCLVKFDPHMHQMGHNLGAAWCAAENMMLQAEAEGLNTGVVSMASPKVQGKLIESLGFDSDEWGGAFVMNVGYGGEIPKPVERKTEGVISHRR